MGLEVSQLGVEEVLVAVPFLGRFATLDCHLSEDGVILVEDDGATASAKRFLVMFFDVFAYLHARVLLLIYFLTYFALFIIALKMWHFALAHTNFHPSSIWSTWTWGQVSHLVFSHSPEGTEMTSIRSPLAIVILLFFLFIDD